MTVSRLALAGWSRPTADLLDLDVEVDCSSGTYVRALARDLGRALGTGGHLTALRRTRVGPFTLADARDAGRAGRAGRLRCRSRSDAAVAAAFPRRELTPRARATGCGTAAGWTRSAGPARRRRSTPTGTCVALVEERGGRRPSARGLPGLVSGDG